MIRILYSLLCSSVLICTFVTSAHSAPQRKQELPPPVVKELIHEWPVSPTWETAIYTFHREEFINPKIVEEMQGPFADSGPQIISINVHNANISNQFFSEVRVRTTKTMPYVYYQEQDKEFGYSLVGITTTGIHIVHTQGTQGGSGVFHTLLFFIYTDTDSIAFGLEVIPSITPTLTLIGSLPLGDRFAGTVTFADDLLTVLPPKGVAQPIPFYSGGLIVRFE